MVIQIKQFNPEKLANAAHLGFNTEVQVFVNKHGAENISCAVEQTLYNAAVLAEVDVVNRQRGSALTIDLDQLDQERDDLVIYIFRTFDASKFSPLAAAQEAHKQLLPFMKSYRGMQDHHNVKESGEIIGMLKDLRAANLATYVATLNIGSVMDLLEVKNNTYIELDSQRVSEMPNKLVTDTLRANVDELYYTIVSRANATVVLATNDAAEAFVRDMNNFIDKTNASYNLRMAQYSKKEETGEPVQDANDTDVSGADSPTEESNA